VNRLVSLLILISLTSFVYAGGAGQGAAVHTLVIDPGHGGMDPGAIGPGGHHESDLALAVSLKFGEMVKEAFPDVKIIYTRTTDKFVSLADRADMANKAKADLFICIHLNSATNHDAYGTATYVLGLHRTDDNLEIAKRENAVIDLEGDKDKKYEFDPNSPEGHIIMSMKQNAFLDQSILIASKIEDELAVLSKRKSHGVKQAGFWVLYKTAMPSLLAEIGFISNPTEEQYLATDAGQENIATSIFKAFRSYKNEIEGKKDSPTVAVAKAPIPTVEKKTEVQTVQPTSSLKANPSNPPDQSKQPQDQPTTKPSSPNPPQPSTSSPNPPAPKKEEPVWQPDTTIVVAPKTPAAHTDTTTSTAYEPIDKRAIIAKDTQPTTMRTAPTKKLVPLRTGNEPSIAKKENPKPDVDTVKKQATTKTKVSTSKQEKTTVPKAKTDTVKSIAAKEPIAPKTVVKQPPAPPAGKASADNVIFTVQILAAHHAPKNYDDLVETFGLINREDLDNGVVRYMVGQYSHYKEAKRILEVAKVKGFPEAFIICYVNDVRQDTKKTYELGLKNP
jgi:N-acetylmuramoyl-L-alanine amidase